MHLFLDCEFNSWNDSGSGELISMALVSLDFKAIFYEVIGCDKPTPWVRQHVIPHLNKEAVRLSVFECKLSDFLWKTDNLFSDGITIVADYPSDIEIFCRTLLLGSETLLRPEQCLLTPMLKFELDMTLSTKNSKTPHNALEDAKALREHFIKERNINIYD